jgi:hypothetical protein
MNIIEQTSGIDISKTNFSIATHLIPPAVPNYFKRDQSVSQA